MVLLPMLMAPIKFGKTLVYMSDLKYLSTYPNEIIDQVKRMIEKRALGTFLLKRHPNLHDIKNDKSLRTYVQDIKNSYLKKSVPLSQIKYDDKIHVIHNALGVHKYITKAHGGKTKVKNEIRIAAVFKNTPPALLRMIVVHELAHIREKEHNKNFYQLCQHMEPNYHQLEFEMRLYLTYLDTFGELYT